MRAQIVSAEIVRSSFFVNKVLFYIQKIAT